MVTFFLTVFVAAAPAANNETHEVVKKAQTFYAGLKDFSAKFQQNYRYQGSMRTQESDGIIQFKKPGMVRFEYKSPSSRTFVLSEGTAYMFDPEAQTLTKSKVDVGQMSASVTFVMGKGDLLKEFDVEKLECDSCEGVFVKLTPKKEDTRFRYLKMEFDKKTGRVIRSVVNDLEGSENTMRFTELKANVGLQKSAFELAIPKSVQVIDLSKQTN